AHAAGLPEVPGAPTTRRAAGGAATAPACGDEHGQQGAVVRARRLLRLDRRLRGSGGAGEAEPGPPAPPRSLGPEALSARGRAPHALPVRTRGGALARRHRRGALAE